MSRGTITTPCTSDDSSCQGELCQAVLKGHSLCVKRLIEAGVDVNGVDSHGSYPIICALDLPCSREPEYERKRREILGMLLKENPDLHVCGRGGITTLMMAAERCDASHVQLLLDADLNVNAIDERGDSVLMRATKCGRSDSVKQLIEAGANIYLADRSGFSALKWASFHGQFESVNALVQAGADVNESFGFDGSTPLMWAVGSYNTPANSDCVKSLLRAGASSNARNIRGETPLLYGVQKHATTESIIALLDAGCDVNAVNCQGDSALILAARALAFSRFPGFDFDFEKCFTNTGTVLIDRGADVNMANKNGNTALIQAVKNGNTSDGQILIDGGADVNTRNIQGETALFVAARCNKTEWAHKLIVAGAEVNLVNLTGNTGLMEAAKNGAFNCAQLLIDVGVDVNVTNRDGCSALILAVKHCRDRKASAMVVNRLLEVGAKINLVSSYSAEVDNDRSIRLVVAAGEKPPRLDAAKMKDLMKEVTGEGISLAAICRETIRHRLMEIDPHTDLFQRVPVLPLPSNVQNYLLYNVSLGNGECD